MTTKAAEPKPPKQTAYQRLSLYDIGLEGRLLEELLIESGGELTPENEARFDELLKQGPQRIEAACKIILELEASAEAAAAEKKRIDARKQHWERQAESLKARVVFAVDGFFAGKVKTDLVNVWTQKAADRVAFDLAADVDMTKLHETNPELVQTEYALKTTELMQRYKVDEAARAAYFAELRAIPEGEEFEEQRMAVPLPAMTIPAEVEVIETPGRRFLRIL